VGKLEDGTVFADTTASQEPLQFTLGESQVIPGFEEAVVGMSPGSSKTTEVSAENAYGPRYDEIIQEVPRENMPEGIEPQVGQQLQATTKDGQSMILTVKDVSDATVTLDGNHPLAGHNLVFDIQLLKIG
jgi:FKBP-type peptidyl-prolyl cis-trans isomerase 2